MTDLAAKARRAAEWLRAEGCQLTEYCNGWGIYNATDHTLLYRAISDRMLIAFCEDRGWQDHVPDAGNMVDEQEADGVEWLLYSEWATFDGRVAAVKRMKDGGWYWASFYEDADVEERKGTAPTRAEARRQAVEAARGMG